MDDKEPFYKTYYKRQTLRGKIKLKWNWFKGDCRAFKANLKNKLKHGWNYKTVMYVNK
ncbi:MAG: hypothetical protein Q8K60_03390 [Parachlamydiaceae bacterium]|nr:hypothetical protein [Parachlamydiaceae bacterium]